MNGQPDLMKLLKHMDDIDHGLVQLTNELRQCIEEVKMANSRDEERFEQEQALAMIAAAANEAQVEAKQVSLDNVKKSDFKESAEATASHQSECSRPENTDNQQEQPVMPIAENPPH